MKSVSYLTLASVLAVTMTAAPICADTNPFGESTTVKLNSSEATTENASTETVVKAAESPKAEESTKTEDVAMNETGTITAEALYIRTSPWGDVAGTYKKGDKVKIVGQTGDWYKVNHEGKICYIHANWVTTSKRQGQTEAKYGTVNSTTALNVHRTPSGDVISKLNPGDQVYILGEVGDWVKIKINNNEAFVQKKYIDNSPSSGASSSSSSSSNTVASSNKSQSTTSGTTASSGSLQANIVKCAKELVGSTAFRGSDVSGGRLACAKVATTALKNAGALDKVRLNCRDAVKDLKAKGWKEVSVPPWQEGDVITWKTYDYTGDGVKDDDTHIGIILKEGNSFKAMNNSSSLRTPRITDPYCIGPISRVLRKA